jgi:CBS domain containing-hemolysin-like protein
MNSIIILANTIFVIGLTVFTTNQLNAENHGAAQIVLPFFGTIALPMEANDAFTGIGVTIILFVFAEMVPKQFANNLKANILAWLWIWIIPVTAIFFIPAFGMAKPFEFLIGRFRADRA